MSILEIALASQILARRREKRQLLLDDADALKVLLRIAYVFVAFTLLISGLNLAAMPKEALHSRKLRSFFETA
ncbi:hypothetical protein ACC690_39460, partial [Rhizobium johnstonii]